MPTETVTVIAWDWSIIKQYQVNHEALQLLVDLEEHMMCTLGTNHVIYLPKEDK